MPLRTPIWTLKKCFSSTIKKFIWWIMVLEYPKQNSKRKMIEKCTDKKIKHNKRRLFSQVLKDANKWEGFNIDTTIAGAAILWSTTAVIRLKFVNVSELQRLTIGIHHIHTYTYFYLHTHYFGYVYNHFYCFQNFSCSYNFILFKNLLLYIWPLIYLLLLGRDRFFTGYICFKEIFFSYKIFNK